MHPQLAAVVADLDSAADRVLRLQSSLSCRAWSDRPGPGRWSPAECVAHLNLTSAALLPRLQSALQGTDGRRGTPTRPYRRDAIGWLIWRIVSPSGGVKTNTVAAYAPVTSHRIDDVVSRFVSLQAALVECVREAEGLPLERIKVPSLIDDRLTVNLYSALTLVPRHQHRHLHQAEQAARLCAQGVPAAAV